jgi:hypothetical protein
MVPTMIALCSLIGIKISCNRAFRTRGDGEQEVSPDAGQTLLLAADGKDNRRRSYESFTNWIKIILHSNPVLKAATTVMSTWARAYFSTHCVSLVE